MEDSILKFGNIELKNTTISMNDMPTVTHNYSRTIYLEFDTIELKNGKQYKIEDLLDALIKLRG